jgi:predicted DNA-binding protein (UPF0251 family)
MSRPPKCRRVEFLPNVTYFKPAGIPLRALDEVRLSVEEVEAIRLKDLEGLEQEEGAGRMDISRATFQRVLASARQKMANALLNGKAIRIEGGSFQMAPSRYKCLNGHEWVAPLGLMASATPRICPVCNTTSIEPLMKSGSDWKRGSWGRPRRGRRI